MSLKTTSKMILAALIVVATWPASARSQNRASNEAGDVQFEMVGQVFNSSPAASIQYGYFTFINGISGVAPLFTAVPQSESSALFTFFNDTVTEGIINNGSIRVINRVGTTTVYLNTSPSGSFSDPNSFRKGVSVQTSTLRHQVVVDTVTGAFTATFVNTITSADRFQVEDSSFRLGKIGQTFRTTFFGHLTTQAPPSAYIAGFAVGPDLVRP
jgi:hypothetical protein